MNQCTIERIDFEAIKFPIEPQCFKVHVDGSYDHEEKIGKIAWVVYFNDKLISTNILPHVRRFSAEALEDLVFKIINQVYDGAKVYTDSEKVWREWKGKNKNRIYLIDHKDNLADKLLKGKEIPLTYEKIPTYKFEYVKIKEEFFEGQEITAEEISNAL